MKCNVIQDLMILYSDNCCSDESKAIVEDHINSCQSCKKAFYEMTKAAIPIEKKLETKKYKFNMINSWKASVMQSVLLFLSFALLVLGVAREAATSSGDTNGLWAFAIIVPTTGFLLSLANWYFVRIYPSRKIFSMFSLAFNVVFVLLGNVWVFVHYNELFSNLFNTSATSTAFLLIGCFMIIFFCVISKVLSCRYAEILGKE